MGVFIATFVYAIATLSWIDRDGNGYVPVLSTYIVVGLVVSSVLLLGLLVPRIGELQVMNVLRIVGNKGRAVIAAMPPLQADQSTAVRQSIRTRSCALRRSKELSCS
jgi:uncharacterized membrane protein